MVINCAKIAHLCETMGLSHQKVSFGKEISWPFIDQQWPPDNTHPGGHPHHEAAAYVPLERIHNLIGTRVSYL